MMRFVTVAAAALCAAENYPFFKETGFRDSNCNIPLGEASVYPTATCRKSSTPGEYVVTVCNSTGTRLLEKIYGTEGCTGDFQTWQGVVGDCYESSSYTFLKFECADSNSTKAPLSELSAF